MIVKIAWSVLALIHALPAMALFQPAMIEKLYGVTKDNPLFLLIHHRAALFLVICLLCIWAAFDPASRRLASVGVGISMISFLVLFWAGGSPAVLKSIAVADLAGIPFLLFVVWRAFAE